MGRSRAWPELAEWADYWESDLTASSLRARWPLNHLNMVFFSPLRELWGSRTASPPWTAVLSSAVTQLSFTLLLFKQCTFVSFPLSSPADWAGWTLRRVILGSKKDLDGLDQRLSTGHLWTPRGSPGHCQKFCKVKTPITKICSPFPLCCHLH